MSKTAVKEMQQWGTFTPFDPNAPLTVLIEAPPPALLVGEVLPAPAVAAVPNVWPAGITYEAFLYSLIEDLDATVEAMGGDDFSTTITNPQDGDILVYDSGGSTFVNEAGAGDFLPLVGGTITGSPGNLIVNAPNGDTGAILTAQVNSSQRLMVSADSDHIFSLADASTSGPTATLRLFHKSTAGTPTVGFGSSLQFWGEDNSGSAGSRTAIEYATIRTEASSTTAGAVSSDLVLMTKVSGTSTETVRFKGSDGRALYSVPVQSPSAHIGDVTTHPATLHVSRAGAASNPTVATYLRVKSVADTSLAQGSVDVEFDLGTTHQLVAGGGTLGQQNAVNVVGPTYSATGALTITEAVGCFLNTLPTAGTNVTMTNRYALYVNGPSRFESGTSGGISYVWKLPTDDTPVGATVGRIPINIGGTLRYIPYHAA